MDGDDGEQQSWDKPNPRMTPNTSGKHVGYYHRKFVAGGKEDYDEEDLKDDYFHGAYPDSDE